MFLKAEEDALSDALQIDVESVSNKSKNSFSDIVDEVVTNSAHKRELTDILDENVEIWAQTSTLMDVIALRALDSIQFKRPVERIVGEKVEKRLIKAQESKKIAEVSFFFSVASPSSSKASAELEKRRHGTKIET